MSEPVKAFTPIHKVLTVKATPDLAFRRFTAEMTSWWPLRSHSVGEADAQSVEMEGRVGGRIVERIRGGREACWGTITAWDPPRRVAFTWHPGQDPATAQDIEVLFTGVDGGTRVELSHWGFERMGRTGRVARRGYPIGWSYVLGLYADRRGPFMLLMSGLTGTLMAAQRMRARFGKTSTA
jgi:uncharacterized protein YndB with AHSA1/START domain